jgi:hypothetical protein
VLFSRDTVTAYVRLAVESLITVVPKALFVDTLTKYRSTAPPVPDVQVRVGNIDTPVKLVWGAVIVTIPGATMKKLAVTVFAASIVTLTGLVEPVASPLQPVNV